MKKLIFSLLLISSGVLLAMEEGASQADRDQADRRDEAASYESEDAESDASEEGEFDEGQEIQNMKRLQQHYKKQMVKITRHNIQKRLKEVLPIASVDVYISMFKRNYKKLFVTDCHSAEEDRALISGLWDQGSDDFNAQLQDIVKEQFKFREIMPQEIVAHLSPSDIAEAEEETAKGCVFTEEAFKKDVALFTKASREMLAFHNAQQSSSSSNDSK